jgi:hypothetical protein
MNQSGSKWQESLYCFCGAMGTLRCDQIKLNLFFCEKIELNLESKQCRKRKFENEIVCIPNTHSESLISKLE